MNMEYITITALIIAAGICSHTILFLNRRLRKLEIENIVLKSKMKAYSVAIRLNSASFDVNDLLASAAKPPKQSSSSLSGYHPSKEALHAQPPENLPYSRSHSARPFFLRRYEQHGPFSSLASSCNVSEPQNED